MQYLRRLRALAGEQAAEVLVAGTVPILRHARSRSSTTITSTLIDGYLTELNFKGGLLMSAQLAAGNRGSGYTLRRARGQSFIERLLDRSGYSFTLADRDDAGARALSELEDRGANVVANASTQSRDHVLSFFVMLRTELGFYVACLNLSDRLTAKGEPADVPRRSSREIAWRCPRAGCTTSACH